MDEYSAYKIQKEKEILSLTGELESLKLSATRGVVQTARLRELSETIKIHIENMRLMAIDNQMLKTQVESLTKELQNLEAENNSLKNELIRLTVYNNKIVEDNQIKSRNEIASLQKSLDDKTEKYKNELIRLTEYNNKIVEDNQIKSRNEITALQKSLDDKTEKYNNEVIKAQYLNEKIIDLEFKLQELNSLDANNVATIKQLQNDIEELKFSHTLKINGLNKIILSFEIKTRDYLKLIKTAQNNHAELNNMYVQLQNELKNVYNTTIKTVDCDIEINKVNEKLNISEVKVNQLQTQIDILTDRLNTRVADYDIKTVKDYLMLKCPRQSDADGKINKGNDATYEDYLFSSCENSGTCDKALEDGDAVSRGLINNLVNCGNWSIPNTTYIYNNTSKWHMSRNRTPRDMLIRTFL
jgi:chromosome segregation ATPase